MIIITGASRGLGRFILEKYIIENENVIGTFLNSNIEDPKLSKLMFSVDVSDFKSVKDFAKRLILPDSELTLINCAGISYNSYLHKSDPEEWMKVINTNLVGVYNTLRVFLPIMRENNFGRIVNFSSVVAQKGTPGVSAYAASKSALWGLVKSVAQENGSKGITINNINLGYVNVGMGVEQVPEKYQLEIKAQIPSNEFCEPIDVFNTIEYLRKTSYINGTSIDLNGGLL